MYDVLFYRVYYSYLQGSIEKTQMFFDDLRQEAKNSGVVPSYTKSQLYKLKEVRDALQTGNITTQEWCGEENSIPVDNERNAAGMKQDELVERIHKQGFGQLKEILLDPSLYLYNIEHPCKPHGRVSGRGFHLLPGSPTCRT